jgi:hypothetical protein
MTVIVGNIGNKVEEEFIQEDFSGFGFGILYDGTKIEKIREKQRQDIRIGNTPKGVSYDSDEIIGRVIKAYFEGTRLTMRGLKAFDSKLLMSLEGRFSDQKRQKPFDSISTLREQTALELERLGHTEHASEIRAYNKNFCNHKKKDTKEKLIGKAIHDYIDNSIDIDQGEIKKTKQGKRFISAIQRRRYKMQEFRQAVAERLEELGRFQEAKKLKEHTKSPYDRELLIYEGVRLAKQGVQLNSSVLKEIYLPFANIVSRQIKKNGKYEPLFFRSWNEFRQEVASRLEKEEKNSLVKIIKKENKDSWSKNKIIEKILDFSYKGYDLSSKNMEQNPETHNLWVAITSYKKGKAVYFGGVIHALKEASEELYEKRKIDEALKILDFIANKKQKQILKSKIIDKCNKDSEKIYAEVVEKYNKYNSNIDISDVKHPNELLLYKRDVESYPELTEKERFSLFYIKNSPFYKERDRQKAREILINCNLKLVLKEAYKYSGRKISLLSLISNGNIGLINAVDEYNHFGRAKFSTYAYPIIKKEIKRSYTAEIFDEPITNNRYQQLGKLYEVQTRHKAFLIVDICY